MVDGLQSAYIRALSGHNMPAWAACFDDPGSYVCICRENEEQGHRIALMMDDNFARIRDRVKFVDVVWKGTFEDYHCRHLVQRTMLSRDATGIITTESNVLITYTDSKGHCGILTSGVYIDQVTITPAGARFRSKRVVLDTTVTPRYLVYPL
jgi:3-phenylpropionate/cinnamic acid dioxygenase small subunit